MSRAPAWVGVEHASAAVTQQLMCMLHESIAADERVKAYHYNLEFREFEKVLDLRLAKLAEWVAGDMS